MTTPAAQRQIRHPHTQFAGADGLAPLPSPGPASTLRIGGSGSGSPGPSATASRRLSKARPPNGYYFASKSAPSSAPSPSLSPSPSTGGPSRGSVDEYNQLLRQANYAANHYDSVYGGSGSGSLGNTGWKSSSKPGGGLSSLSSTSSATSKSSGTLGQTHARARSKTPDGDRITSHGGIPHPHPYFDRSRVGSAGQRTQYTQRTQRTASFAAVAAVGAAAAAATATTTTATMVAAPPSATPSRPSRNNTANLHDNPFDLSYSTSTTTTDAGSGSSSSNLANRLRQRRMSLPSGPAAHAAAHDGQFVADPQDMFAPGPSDHQSNSYGTLSQSSFSGMRSRSGTQSQKSKKSMLSFMSGTSSSAPSALRPSRSSLSLLASRLPSPRHASSACPASRPLVHPHTHEPRSI